MTKIVSLKLKNFKSFRKAEIPFAEGFTAIAGANASGKSNILDSLLFAMGITSLKMLRASRLTELVNHDASEGYAKVELVLKDANGKEILITRMVDRQGKGIFKLDEKRKTLNEIQSLLLELGLNPYGHNIVVQGDITRVIEMNAKQRREMIEEVAGLQEFEEKKEEALKKLEKVEQRVKDATIVLNEREKYLGELEKERELALKFNSLQEELKISKATILSEEIKIVRQELAGAHKRIEAMQREIESKRKEAEGLQQEEKEIEGKVEEITSRLIEAGEKTYSTFGRDIEQKKGKLNLLDEKISSKKESLESRTARVQEISSELKELKKTKEEKEAQLKGAKEGLEEAKAALAKIRAMVSAKTPKLGEGKGKASENEARISELWKSIEEKRAQWHEAVSRKRGLEKDAKSAAQALQELEPELKKTEARLAEKKALEKRLLELERKSPAEKARAKEHEAEKTLSEIHLMKGHMEHLNESLGLLSKAKADCPLCEKPLEAHTKKGLEEKRGKEVSALKARVKGLEEARAKLADESARLKAEERELHETKTLLKSFHGIEEQLLKLREKIPLHRKMLDQKEIEKAQAEENLLAKSIEALEKERRAIKAKVKEFRESPANAEMNALIEKMHSLNEGKSAMENSATKLSTELEQVIESRLSSHAHESEKIEKETVELKKSLGAMEQEKIGEAKQLEKMEAELEKANRANKLLEEEKERLTTKIRNISQKREELALKVDAKEKELNEFNLQQSRNEVRIVDLEEEFKEYDGVKALQEFRLNDLKKRIPEIDKEVESLGAINMKSLENFGSYRKEVDEVREKALKLEEERKAVLEMIDKIEVKKLSVFMECFNHVSAKFSELYYNFFEGEGKLELGDSLNPLEGGLLIQAKYKEDTLKSIDAMSGGEKSLTALAFLFAIQSFEPAPFYIFDEVDAALDKENSVKVGRMIKSISGKSQFISISHNDSVINQADQIIGVALNRHKSSVIGLKLPRGEYKSGAEEEAAAQP